MTLHRILSVNNLEMYPLWIQKSPHSRYRYLLSLYCKLTRVERKEERNIPFSFNLIPWSILPSFPPDCVACYNVCPTPPLHGNIVSLTKHQALGSLFIFRVWLGKITFPLIREKTSQHPAYHSLYWHRFKCRKTQIFTLREKHFK